MKTQYPMIPFPLIVKATDGDTEAINQILHHYRGYITKRSLRLMKDEYGKCRNESKGITVHYGTC